MRVRIIPCLDVFRRRVTKGKHFLNLVDLGDPVYLAQKYCEEGADELVLLNINAAKESEEDHNFCRLITNVALRINIPLTAGGGLNTVQKVRRLLNSGADKVSLNSSAMAGTKLLENLAASFGSQCTTVAVDATKRTKTNNWEVLTHGGSLPTGTDAVNWVKRIAELGAGEILLTSIDQDGTSSGFDVGLTNLIVKATSLPVIASGGGGSCSDCAEVVRLTKVRALLLAGILHTNKRSVSDIRRHLNRES